MANFRFQKQDLQDQHSLAQAFNAHTISRNPDGGAAKPLRTTQSVDPDPQKGITTYSVSEIMQGSSGIKPQTASYDVFNQITSNSLATMLADPMANPTTTLGNQAQVVPEDVMARAGALGAKTLDTAAGAGQQNTGAGAPVTGTVAIVIEEGRKQIGKPYVWGAVGPDAFDCSGFTSWCWRKGGVEIGRNTHTQYGQTKHIDMSEIQPGDLIFYDHQEHVVLYIGNNQCLNAPNSRSVVRYDNIDYWKTDRVASRPG